MPETVSIITQALLNANKNFKNVTKNKVNPHFKSRYADLDAIFEATREALLNQGFIIIQHPITDLANRGAGVKTILKHISGEEISNEFYLPVDGTFNPQTTGSAFTYARRYGLQSILGITADEDDDGNAATGAVRGSSARASEQDVIPGVKNRFLPVSGPPRAEIPLAPLFNSEGPLDKESAKPFTKAVKDIGKSIGENGLEQIREYIKRTTGKTESKNLTKSEWESILSSLETARKTETLTNLLSGE